MHRACEMGDKVEVVSAKQLFSQSSIRQSGTRCLTWPRSRWAIPSPCHIRRLNLDHLPEWNVVKGTILSQFHDNIKKWDSKASALARLRITVPNQPGRAINRVEEVEMPSRIRCGSLRAAHIGADREWIKAPQFTPLGPQADAGLVTC